MVIRYQVYGGSMSIEGGGPYVKVSDYELLAAELANLKRLRVEEFAAFQRKVRTLAACIKKTGSQSDYTGRDVECVHGLARAYCDLCLGSTDSGEVKP